MKKSLIFVAVCALMAVFGYVKAANGDFATLGYNSTSGVDYWRVISTGDLVPGAASSYDVGSAALPVDTVYAGNISASTITGSGNIVNTSGQIVFQSISSTTLRTTTPAAAGAVVYCTTYASLCVSTGTGVGGWVFVSTNGFTGTSTACDE